MIIMYKTAELPAHSFDTNSQIFGHKTGFNRFNTHSFQSLTETFQLGIVIQLGAMFQTASPCINGS